MLPRADSKSRQGLMTHDRSFGQAPQASILRRWRWARREQASLDPEVEHERLVHLCFEVRLGAPLFVVALYTIAFARQMAVPSIARVVHRSGGGDILRETRARNDLTLNFFGRFMRHGHSSEAGRSAIAELNAIHARFPIEDHESLYTLSSLAFEPLRLGDQLGAALLAPEEEQAFYHFWAGVAQHMDRILPVPSRDEFWRWTLDYERERFAYTPGGRGVVDAMLDDFAARLPAPVRALGRQTLLAAMDDHLRSTHRLGDPRGGAHTLAAGAGRAFAAAKRVPPDPSDRSWADHFRAPERHAELTSAGSG